MNSTLYRCKIYDGLTPTHDFNGHNCNWLIFPFSDPLKAVTYEDATKGQFKFQVRILHPEQFNFTSSTVQFYIQYSSTFTDSTIFRSGDQAFLKFVVLCCSIVWWSIKWHLIGQHFFRFDIFFVSHLRASHLRLSQR